MTSINFVYTVSLTISAPTPYMIRMGLSAGEGPVQFVIEPGPKQTPAYFSLKDLVQQLGKFLGIPALENLCDLGSGTLLSKVFSIEIAPRFVVSIGKAANDSPSGFQCVLSLYDNGQYGIKFGGESIPGITIEPNFTVYDLIIGYSADGDGLQLRARITFQEQQSALAARRLLGGDPSPIEKTEIVSYPFVKTTSPNPTFRIDYLGLGQRFGPDADLSAPDPIAKIFTELEANLTSNDPQVILNTLVQKYYKPDRNWFIAADVYVRGWRVRAIFNDPALYGLEITCDVDQFKGLLVEILYQKLGPHLGVYYGALNLPEAYRQVQLGVVALTIPGFKIWIYTNGDFKVAVGWPLGPNSIGLQVLIFTGGAGFYFAKLRSGDNPQNPNPPVNYNPILAFGLGLWLGVGRSINQGVLSAQISLTVQGTLQGILAWEAQSVSGGSNLSRAPDYFWFAATVGIVGVLQGSVDLKIITASVLVQISMTTGLAFETSYGTKLSAQAVVDVKVTVKVVFVKITASFHMQIAATFNLTTSANGWACLAGPNNPAFASIPPQLVPALAAPPQRSVSRQKLRRFLALDTSVTVNLYFLLQPTAVYADSASLEGVALLLIPNPDNPANNQDFLNLLTVLAKWLLATYSPSKSSWADVALALGDNEQGAPPNFDAELTSLMLATLKFVLNPVDLTANNQSDLQMSIFPMFEQLQVSYTGHNQPIPFAQTKTPLDYPDLVTTYFQQLSINGLMSNPSTPPTLDMARILADPPDGPSLASFIFFDYFLLVARDLARELGAVQQGLGSSAGLPPMPDAKITASIGGLASRFMLYGLRLPDPNQIPPDGDPYKFVLESAYLLTNQQFPVDATLSTLSATLSVADPSGLGSLISFAAPPTAGDPPPSSVTSVMPVQPLPPAPAPSWSSSVIAGLLAASQAAVHIQQLEGVLPQTAWYTSRRPLIWNLPGAPNTYLTPLPLDVSQLAAQVPLLLQVQTTAPGVTPEKQLTYAPALFIQLSISRVPVVQDANVDPAGQAAAAYLPNLYQLSAADEETRELIYSALTQADLSQATISLLYNAGQSGYQSDTLDTAAHPVGVFKTNLSTSSQPDLVNVQLLHLFRADDPAALGPTSATLADAAAFLQLLWEVSVVNATGFFLHYADKDGKGLDQALFSGGTADLVILVEFPQDVPVSAYHNFLKLSSADPLVDSVYINPRYSTNHQVLLQYNPSYPAGCIGFTINWDEQTAMLADPHGPSELYTDDWIVQLYHLIQFKVLPTNGSSPQFLESLWSAPLSPLAADDNDQHFTYRQVLPVYLFAGDKVSDQNSLYAGIGGKPSVQFRLGDIFGNVLTTYPYTVNFPVLYNDRLISVAEWPGIAITYRFLLDSKLGPLLRLSVTFDPQAVIQTNESFLRLYGVARPDSQQADDDDKAEQQAAIALYKYITICDQYNDTNITVTLATTVLPSNGGVIGDEATLKTDLQAIAAQAVAELQKVIDHSGTPLAFARNIDIPISISDVQNRTDNIFAVTTTLSVSRPAQLVDPSTGTNLPDAINKLLIVKADLDMTPVEARTDPNGQQQVGVTQFAQDFEATFANFDDVGGLLKLATRKGLDTLSAPADTPFLWALRWSQNHGLNATISPNEVAYFTPAPLSNELISNSALIRIYDDQLNYRKETLTFADIDVDSWARIFLGAMNVLTEPGTAAAIAFTDPASYALLMEYKSNLADAVAQGLVTVFEQPQTAGAATRKVIPGDWQSAHDRFEQTLLADLTHAYTTSAVVQLPAQITISGQTKTADPTLAPRFFGSVEVDGAHAPQQIEYTITSAKLQLAPSTQSLNFLVSAAQPGLARDVQLPLTYSVGFCEFLFESGEEEYGYVPSSWLKFVLTGSGTPFDIPLNAVDVPIPLRAFPSKPVLIGQFADQDSQQKARLAKPLHLSGADGDNPIADALKWDYTVRLQRGDQEAQDALWLAVTYNVPMTNLGPSGFAARHFSEADYPGDITGLFQALARFSLAYPVLQPFIVQLNSLVFGGQTLTDLPDAKKIISVILDEVANVTSHWGALRGITDKAGDPIFPVSYRFSSRAAFLASQQSPNLFVIEFPSAGEGELLQVYASGVAGVPPFPSINGQTINAPPQPVPLGYGPDEEHTWYTTTINYQELSDGLIELLWTKIDALDRQTATTQCYIVRNADLSKDPTLHTNPALIYKTAAVTFPSPVLPLITVPHIVLRPGLTLADYLKLILEPVAQAGSAATSTRIVRLEAQYKSLLLEASQPGQVGLYSETAILLADGIQLQAEGAPVPANPAVDDPVALSVFIERLVADMNTWYQSTQPLTDNAVIVLDVVLFASIAGAHLPILQLRDIEISVPLHWWTT